MLLRVVISNNLHYLLCVASGQKSIYFTGNLVNPVSQGFNPLIPNIKIQILLSCAHTFLEELVEVVKSKEFILCDHILNSPDPSD